MYICPHLSSTRTDSLWLLQMTKLFGYGLYRTKDHRYELCSQCLRLWYVVCVTSPVAPLLFPSSPSPLPLPISPPPHVQVLLMGHENSVRAATYLPEGQRVVSGYLCVVCGDVRGLVSAVVLV